ncbi:MAG: hypothetical protein RL701_7331 [Pseudomonadota bacterium]|jgi:uncharacterized membrane protein
MNTNVRPVWPEPRSSVLTIAQVSYALHAISLCIGAFTAAGVVSTFLFGWPSVIAVILNYILRGDARGTWLEAHYTWQIRTFWLVALWSLLVVAVSFPLKLILIGFVTRYVGLGLIGLWACVRVGWGWWRLRNNEIV